MTAFKGANKQTPITRGPLRAIHTYITKELLSRSIEGGDRIAIESHLENMAGFTPGQFVRLTDHRQARIRFVGTTHFAPGDWIGVELEEPTGKNNGTVQGESYFECEQLHGMFVRSTAIGAVLEPPKREPTKVASRAASSNADARGRAPSATAGGAPGIKRQSGLSTTNIKRHSSTTSSPSPAAKVASTGRSLRVRCTLSIDSW